MGNLVTRRASLPATSAIGNRTSKVSRKPLPTPSTSAWWLSLPCYRWALAHDQVSRDPTVDVTTIRVVPLQPQSLSTRQLRRLLRAVHNGGSARDVAIIEMLAGTGLRVGELLQLQIGDVVLRDRSGWVIVREGKQGGYREVPLTQEVRQALADYLETGPAVGHQEEETPLWWGKQGPLTHRS